MRPGPDAEDAQAAGETESLGVTEGGRVGAHHVAEARPPLSPSGAYLPDVSSSDPTRPLSPSGSLFTPSAPKASDESTGSPRRAESLSPSGSWFTPKTTVPKSPAPEPPAPESPALEPSVA